MSDHAYWKYPFKKALTSTERREEGGRKSGARGEKGGGGRGEIGGAYLEDRWWTSRLHADLRFAWLSPARRWQHPTKLKTHLKKYVYVYIKLCYLNTQKYYLYEECFLWFFFSTWELKSKNNESEITIELLKSVY